MVLRGLEVHLLPFGENLMTPSLLVPLRQCCRLMHVFEYLPPTHTGVVGAEGDLSLLRTVGNHTHFCSAEIVRPEVLEPHPFDTEDTPFVLLRARFHPVVPIAVGSLRAWLEEVDDL